MFFLYLTIWHNHCLRSVIKHVSLLVVVYSQIFGRWFFVSWHLSKEKYTRYTPYKYAKNSKLLQSFGRQTIFDEVVFRNLDDFLLYNRQWCRLLWKFLRNKMWGTLRLERCKNHHWQKNYSQGLVVFCIYHRWGHFADIYFGMYSVLLQTSEHLRCINWVECGNGSMTNNATCILAIQTDV